MGLDWKTVALNLVHSINEIPEKENITYGGCLGCGSLVTWVGDDDDEIDWCGSCGYHFCFSCGKKCLVDTGLGYSECFVCTSN